MAGWIAGAALLGATSGSGNSSDILTATVTAMPLVNGSVTLQVITTCSAVLDGAVTPVTVQIPASSYAYVGARILVQRIGLKIYLIETMGEVPWINFGASTLAAGVAQYGLYQPAQYRRVATLVEARGLLSNGALAGSGSVCFMPPGYWPTAPNLGVWMVNNAAARWNITASGTIASETGAAAGYTSLQGVFWKTN